MLFSFQDMADEEEDVDDDGDEEYEPDQPIKTQSGKPFSEHCTSPPYDRNLNLI